MIPIWEAAYLGWLGRVGLLHGSVTSCSHAASPIDSARSVDGQIVRTSVIVLNGAMDTDPLHGLRGLWAYSPAIDGVESSCIHLRDLTDDECAQVARALVLLTELTVGAPYIELQRTHQELVDALDRFVDAPDQYTAHDFAAEVRRRFRHWLSDVTTFTDRVRPMVSRLFGRSHSLFTLVGELKTAESMSNFAYELVVGALRDESTHSHEVSGESFQSEVLGQPSRTLITSCTRSLAPHFLMTLDK